MPEVTTLSSKFQISIPKVIRVAHRWEAGQKFAFLPKGGVSCWSRSPSVKS